MSIYVRAIFVFPSFLYIVGPLSKLAYTHVLYIFLLLKATQIRLFAFCVVLIQSIVIFKKGGTYSKLSPNYMSHAMMTSQVFVIRVL